MENDSTFVAPEGVYSVTEEHKPFLLVAHNVNVPLAPYPTRVSSVVVRYPPSKAPGGAPGFAQLLNVGSKDKGKDGSKSRDDGISQSSSDTGDDEGSPALDVSPSIEPHSLFAHAPAGPAKKRVVRPKQNIRTTSSTFITRIQTAEGSAKALNAKQGDTTFLFYNSGKSFLWVEVGSKSKEPLARVTFSAHPTCHDVNTFTASPERLDVIIGFSTGDLVWLGIPPLRGCISNSPCTAVRWVPSSSTLFLVSHADGTIIVYDKERDDGTFKAEDPSSSKEWDPVDNIFVTMPPWHPVSGLKTEKEKAVKNPVSHWRVSRKSIVDFVFSPDVKYVGAISEDGCLRVIDALAEQLVDCYASYFGALTCIAWSPDGRFILTGGQDDLLTIFSPWEQRVVARCQGHSSFVTSVAFDDLRCDGRTYRFGSVGEDNKLILWDFSSGTLHRPKFHATHHQRVSMSSTVSLAFRHDRSALHLPSVSPTDEKPYPRYHPAPSRNEVAVVQPVLTKQVEGDLLAAVAFLQRSVLTASKTGLVKLWIRPLALRARKNGHRAHTAAFD
ncbi:WD40 repeat-like protein [Hymenopellis radicata]|nr:WD40 repeat-like protein [Hymenopellis radicata]